MKAGTFEVWVYPEHRLLHEPKPPPQEGKESSYDAPHCSRGQRRNIGVARPDSCRPLKPFAPSGNRQERCEPNAQERASCPPDSTSLAPQEKGEDTNARSHIPLEASRQLDQFPQIARGPGFPRKSVVRKSRTLPLHPCAKTRGFNFVGLPERRSGQTQLDAAR